MSRNGLLVRADFHDILGLLRSNVTKSWQKDLRQAAHALLDLRALI